MKTEPTSQQPLQASRRRLLRGSFSAPAVLTLYSGSALATTSNMRCLANKNQSPSAEPVITSSTAPTSGPGTYLRVRLYKWSDGTNTYHYLRANELVGLPLGAGVTWPGTGTAYRFSISGNSLTTTLINTNSTPTFSQLVAADKYAALRVNSTGQVVGIGVSGGGSAMPSTCWTSFRIG